MGLPEVGVIDRLVLSPFLIFVVMINGFFGRPHDIKKMEANKTSIKKADKVLLPLLFIIVLNLSTFFVLLQRN